MSDLVLPLFSVVPYEFCHTRAHFHVHVVNAAAFRPYLEPWASAATVIIRCCSFLLSTLHLREVVSIMPEHSTADQVAMQQRQESPPREGDQAAVQEQDQATVQEQDQATVQEQERRDPRCDSNLSVNLHRSESGDSLSSRLNAAQINSNLNRALQYNEPPKADHTPIRPFLKTARDEEEDLKIQAASGTPAIQKRHLPPPASSDSSQLPPLSNMDRKLRQNKPRLLLMGQRR